MRRVVQSLLAAAAVGCALALSASSTVRLVASVGVPGWAHPAAVGMLEVVTVTGTWLLLTDPRMRWEAAGAVALSSTVTGIGGVLAYGAFGLVPPACSIVVVHLIARAWSSPPDPDPAGESDPVAGEPGEVLPERSPAPLPDVAPAGENRATELIAAGAGRRRLSRELAITEHEARQLLDRERERVLA